jgi:hypothetical protein
MAERDRRIQEIAYLLWEQEGRPDGQAERFWHEAEAQYEAESALTEQDEKAVAPPEAGAADYATAEAVDDEADAAVVEAAAPSLQRGGAGSREPEASKKQAPAKARAAPEPAPVAKAKPKAKAADARTVQSPLAKPRAAPPKRKP